MTAVAKKRLGDWVNIGDELCSTYRPHGSVTKHMIKDFYDDARQRLMKSAGFTGYNTLDVFNAIMGKEIMIGMYACNNIMTAYGARPYDHEGVRIAYSLPQKGGIGATTVRDGRIPDSVKMPVKQVREPYKDLPYAFDYGLGLKALENKDDTIAYQSYIDNMTASYADGIDYDMLRPISTAQPTFEGEETTVNGIARLMASSTLVGETVDGTEITGDMVAPWGGVASDLYDVRTADKQNNFDAYVDANGGVLGLADMNNCYAGCAPYWADQANPNNKIWGMSIVALEKIGSLIDSQNLWLESVYVQRDFNGVKTMPGREVGGILASAYRNVPIIMDGNYNYDLTIDRIGNGMGQIQCLDLDHQWLSMLTPIEFRSTEDFAITRYLREQCAMTMRAELRADRFLGSGLILNKTVE